MKLRNVVEEAVQELFAKLLAKPEGEWMVVTLTKGRTTSGRKAIFKRLEQMCQLMMIQITTDSGQFRMCKGFPNEWKDYAAQQVNSYQSQLYKAAIGSYNGGSKIMLNARGGGKTTAVQQILRSMNKPLPRGKP